MPYKPALPAWLHLIELPTTGSTNDYAKELARNAYPNGTIVWAHEQTAGRGRQGNTWVSEPGNLFMSMILRPKSVGVNVGQLSFVAAVALANVLAALVPRSTQLHLKWPNDLLLKQKKAAGILIETENWGMHTSPWVVIGVGVNINSAPENAISLEDVSVRNCEPGYLLEKISQEIWRLAALWEKSGFETIRQLWLARAYRLGKEITANLPRETVTGIFEGLDQTGALLLTLPDGSRKTITSGMVYM